MQSKLAVSQSLYESRRDRMRKLIDLDAPACVIGAEARLIASCFKPSWRDRRLALYVRLPHWVLWLIWPDYRRMDWLDKLGEADDDE